MRTIQEAVSSRARYRTTEQRRNRRFRANGSLFAVFIFTSHMEVGEVIDMSKGGLAVVYSGNGGQLCQSSQVDLFLKQGIHLRALPCTVIYDIEAHCEASPSPLGRPRRCGIELGSLTKNQAAMLEEILASHGRRINARPSRILEKCPPESP